MSNHEKSHNQESFVERLSRLGRNFNAIGALALAGLASVIPGPNLILSSWAGLNAAQAGGFEAVRQTAKNHRQKRTITKANTEI